MIICVVAKMGGGKGLIATVLANSLAIPVIEVSDIVREVTGSTEREILQLEAEKQKDPMWLYKKLKAKINGDCVVSGIREPFLLEQLQKDFGKENIQVTKIKICDKRRRERLMKRDSKSIEQIFKEEKGDEKLGIDEVLKTATYSVDTNGSLERSTEKTILLASFIKRDRENESNKRNDVTTGKGGNS